MQHQKLQKPEKPKQPMQQRPQQQKQQQQQQKKGQETWNEVVRRKKKTPATSLPTHGQRKQSAISKAELLRQRTPKTAAVTIDRPAGGGSLAAVMKKVSEAVDLTALGVKVFTTRRTRAGGILLEVDGVDKAGLLEEKIRQVVGEVARVRKPERRTPVLLLDVPEWAETEDVVGSLAKAGVIVAASDGSLSIRKNGGRRGDHDRVARVELPTRSPCPRPRRSWWVGLGASAEEAVHLLPVSAARTPRRGVSNKAKPRTCFGCGGSGHLARDCPRGEGRRSSDAKDNNKAP